MLLREVFREMVEKIKDIVRKMNINIRDFVTDTISELRTVYSYEKKLFTILVLYGILFLWTFVVGVETLVMVYNFNYFYLQHIGTIPGFIINILMFIAPFVLWIVATSETIFYYHERKIRLFIYGLVNFVVIVVRYTVYFTARFTAPKILSIKPNDALTAGMIVWTERVIVVIPAVIVAGIIIVNLKRMMSSREFMNVLKNFGILSFWDFRKNKEYLYDQKIVKNLETGKDIPFLYGDRFMHQFFQGASGTGKTTAAICRMVWYDLKKKKINSYKRHEEYVKMLDAGEAFLINEGGKINPDNIRAHEGFEKKLEGIKKKYEDIGYTIIAPDTDLQKRVIEYLKILGIDDYYLCDPETSNGKFKDHYKGINVMRVNRNQSLNDYVESVKRQISLTAEMLQAVFDESGSTNIYFTNVNSSCTLHIGAILIASMPYVENREATLADLRYALNDFKLDKYIDALERVYGRGRNVNPFDMDIQWVRTSTSDSKLRDKLIQEANGLRNTIDILLAIPSVRDTLCSQDPIEYEDVLDNGKIVFLNYGLRNGKTIAKGLGLSYILSFHNEVKKRNLDEYMTPHFEVVDEFSQLMHSSWEDAVDVLRKYRMAFTFSFQSNAQFMKNEFTRYMAQIILGVGQMIVFGRTDDVSSKLFSAMGGKERKDMVQDTVSQTSLWESDPSYSESQRITETREDYMDASDVRNRKFLEVSVYPIYNGDVLPPVLGKLNFLSDKEKNDIPEERYIDFEKYVEDSEPVLLNKPVDIITEDGDFRFGFADEISKDEPSASTTSTPMPTKKEADGSMDMMDYM